MRAQRKPKTTILIEQPAALSVYLDTLLKDLPDATSETPNPAPDGGIIETERPAVEDGGRLDIEGVVDAQEQTAPAHPTLQIDLENEPSQCLLFKLAGMTLAAPLLHLDGIVTGVDQVSATPGRPSWMLGMARCRGDMVRLLDPTCLIAPERHPARESISNRPVEEWCILLIGNKRWGLVCDDLLEVITVQPGDVRWSHDRHHKPWLAGMMASPMAALLDLNGLAGWLETRYLA